MFIYNIFHMICVRLAASSIYIWFDNIFVAKYFSNLQFLLIWHDMIAITW